jgi:hypothetical protein
VQDQADQITFLSCDLIQINLLIFTELYSAYYQTLKENNLLPMPVVVDDQGIIPHGKRIALLPAINEASY